MDVISYSAAKKAQKKADSVQEQLNQAVADGDQLAETQQARVDEKGNPHATLKERLDAEKVETDQKLQTVTTQLAHKVSHGENESVTWGMLDQSAKENIVDGNIPIVGVDAVNTTNIVDGAVTIDKFSADIKDSMAALLAAMTNEDEEWVVE